jgi:hypothetical protein
MPLEVSHPVARATCESETDFVPGLPSTIQGKRWPNREWDLRQVSRRREGRRRPLILKQSIVRTAEQFVNDHNIQ